MSHEALPYKNERSEEDALMALAAFNKRYGTSSDTVADAVVMVKNLGYSIKTREGQIKVQEKIWSMNKRAFGI
jgi:uncharacterized protein YwgA